MPHVSPDPDGRVARNMPLYCIIPVSEMVDGSTDDGVFALFDKHP
jgi:hypothetical protein